MTTDKDKPDRHSQARITLRLNAQLQRQLEALVKRNASSLNEEIRIAIRQHLEKAALWPPPTP